MGPKFGFWRGNHCGKVMQMFIWNKQDNNKRNGFDLCVYSWESKTYIKGSARDNKEYRRYFSLIAVKRQNGDCLKPIAITMINSKILQESNNLLVVYCKLCFLLTYLYGQKWEISMCVYVLIAGVLQELSGM